jgi:hypothetical protein
MISSLFATLAAGLSLWEHKDKNKYVEKMLSLKKDYYEEYNKERHDMARLDNITFELQLTSEAFSAQVRIAKA